MKSRETINTLSPNTHTYTKETHTMSLPKLLFPLHMTFSSISPSLAAARAG